MSALRFSAIMAEQSAKPFVQTIRGYECGVAIRELPPTAKILEVGGGSGWQARMLADQGYDVVSIDIASSHYLEQTVFPVQIYDGRHIPFEDATFDVVFTSNVLEHIGHLDELQREFARVLKPGGIGCHIVPTATWRFWTSLAHYLALGPLACNEWVDGISVQSARPGDSVFRRLIRGGSRALLYLASNLFARRHGERGNALTELWWFRVPVWKAIFVRQGWTVVKDRPIRLIYTGYNLCGAWLTIPTRVWLSTLLGSSCQLFIIRQESEAV